MTHTSQSWQAPVVRQVITSLLSTLTGMETWPACLGEASLGAVWGRQADRVAAPVCVAMHGSARGLSPGSRRALWAGLRQPGSAKHLLQGSPRVLRELVQLRVRPVSLQKHPSRVSGLREHHPHVCSLCRVPHHQHPFPCLRPGCSRHSLDMAQSAQQSSCDLSHKSLQVARAVAALLVCRGG